MKLLKITKSNQNKESNKKIFIHKITLDNVVILLVNQNLRINLNLSNLFQNHQNLILIKNQLKNYSMSLFTLFRTFKNSMNKVKYKNNNNQINKKLKY